MKITLKEKNGMMVKSIIFQIAMSIFGMMITSSMIGINENLLWASGIFSVLFYFALIGAAINEDGLKDNIRVTHGRAHKDIFMGFKYIAVSYIPTILITIVHIVISVFFSSNALTTVLNMLIRLFLSGMYLGIDRAIFGIENGFVPFSQIGWSFLIYQILSILICGVFYILGLNGINLLGKKKEEK